MRGLFITGTDTDVGKTYVAAQIVAVLRAQAVRVGAYKPVLTGIKAHPDRPTYSDLDRLHDALGGAFPRDRICPQSFAAPLAPPVAARIEGTTVDSALLRSGFAWWREKVDFLVVEGAGGLLSPLTDTESVADLAASFMLPLVIVARLSLGTINHTLLSVEAARSRNLPIAGIILNHSSAPDAGDRSTETNRDEIQKRCTVPILAVLPYEPAAGLPQHSPLSTIDWMRIMERPSGLR